jgi:uncharacterized membrane-anchored protein YjiN (DUF445 family)
MRSAKVIRPEFRTDIAAQYRNLDHDPGMLETVELMRQSNKTNSMISTKCGVSKTCLRNWQKGKTKRPQITTLRFVLRALGYDLSITRR